MGENRKVKIVTVGQKPSSLPDYFSEVEYEGNTIAGLLKSIKLDGSKTALYDEIVQSDNKSEYNFGCLIAVNGSVIRPEEFDNPMPNLSELVVIHLVQTIGGG